MKLVHGFGRLSAAIALLIAASHGFAADDTQSLLIDKLQRVYTNLAPNDTSKVPVGMRLADLLADRARVASMKDLDSGCTVCTAGKEDRERALRLYQDALPSAPVSSKGRVMIQIGHLYELNGDEKEAIKYYQTTLSSDNAAIAGADANLSLAEIFFKKNQFKDAQPYYAKVLADPKAGSRGLAAYRLAWCELNNGDLAAGLEQLKQILRTKELQSKSGIAEGNADRQFVEEVSRDLATWMAKGAITQADVDELAKLTPEVSRLATMVTLAAELDRSGKKPEALMVWQFVQHTAPQPDVRLEAQIRIIPLLWKEDATDESLKTFDSALSTWREIHGCGRADCTENQKSLRAFLVNWNQTEKKKPSENLLKAYREYLKTFPNDAEMAEWGSQAAAGREDWKTATEWMHLAVVEYSGKKDNDKLESALLSELEIGEMSKDKALWGVQAQNYLTMSPKKTKAFEVRYQQARNLYDGGDNKAARDQLRVLALEPAAPRELRVQAAHLSLDALNLMKDEANLGADAQIFATTFGGETAQEFKEIKYKTSMNGVAKLADGNAEQAFVTLAAVDTSSIGDDDKKLYLKNKIILAEKTKRFDIAASTTDDYLALKNLTAEEREFGLSKKAWLSELRLDFVTAMQMTKGLQSTLKPDQKALKLAIYADLSGTESQAYYQQYLNVGTDPAVKQAIAAQLVRKNKTPMTELNKQSAILAKDPELLARLYTEIYIKNPDSKTLAKMLSDKRIEKTAWGRSLFRVWAIGEIQPLATKLAGMTVDSKTQKTMASTIKTRAVDLAKLEKVVQKTIEAGDWTTELVGLSVLAKESERFYQEILSLPVPEGLSGEDESQYLQLLTQQASPYKNRADTAKAKVTELWATAGWKEALQKSLNDAGEFKSLAVAEIDALKSVADKENLAAIEAIQASPAAVATKPTAQVLEQARNEVRQNPVDRARIEKLLSLEKQAGDFAMVHYLEGRLQQEKSL